VTVGAFAVNVAITTAMLASRIARWFWDKMIELGDSMLQDFLLASGSFSTIGGLRAYRTAFGGLPEDPGMLPAMVQARGAMASKEYAALKLLGIKSTGDSADLMVQATLAAANFMRHQNKGQELMLAEAMVLTSVIGPERLLALKDADPAELQALKEAYERYKPLMQISDKARQGWINFRLQVKATGAQIVSVIAETLADPASPFTQALVHLSQSIARFIKVFMEAPVTKEIVDKLGEYIDEFAKWLVKPETTLVIKKFMDDVKSVVKSAIEAIKYLKQMIDIWRGTVPAAHGRRALAHRLRMERPAGGPPIAPAVPIQRYPGRAAFTKKIAIARPTGAPPVAYPEAAPIARYPGRARFTEKIGVAQPPNAPRISPRPVRPEPSNVRQAPVEGIRPPTGQLRGGQVNSSDLYNTYKEKFKNSPLNGYVPKDGAQWGIKTGSPDEWARLATATSKQESGLNANVGAGLNQFTTSDLRRYGVGGNVNDPNAQVDALVSQWSKHIKQDGVVSQPAPGNPGTGNAWLGAGRYFGSMRDKGWHGKTHADVSKYLGPGGWADQAQKSASGSTSSGESEPTPPATRQGTEDLPPAMNAATGRAPDAFIMHHTGGRGTSQGVENTLRQRGLGVEYVMERDGTIRQIGGPGSANIMNESRYRNSPILGEGKPFLTNRNIVGMEVIAKDDKDVTPAQRAAAARFIRERYPNTPVFGHGEVNPGHKEADEGMTITNSIRQERARGISQGPPSGTSRALPDPSETVSLLYPNQTRTDISIRRPPPHPIDDIKVDNRSDGDVSHAKTTSDNDDGSSQPAEDVTRFAGHREEMDKQFSKPSVAKPFEYGIDMPTERFKPWRKAEDIEDRRERTPNIRYLLGNRKGGDPEVDPLPSKMGADLGMADVLRGEQKKTMSENTKMYLQRQIDTYEKLKRGEKVEEEGVAPPSAEELQ
jgi:hypothetical protein